MGAKLILVAGATILSLVLGSVGAVAVLPDQPVAEGAVESVQIPQRFRARVYGAIGAMDGGTLTVSTPAGPVDFVTDVNTLFFADRKRVTLDDFAIGDVVGAVGWWEDGGGVFHAFAVAKLAEDRLFPVAGTLAEIDGNTLTVETPGRLSATVHVDAETEYRIRGVEDPGLDDLEVGMRVIARGTLNPDGSLQAQVVGAGQASPRHGRLRGEIVVIEEDTLTIRTEKREIVLPDDAARLAGKVTGIESTTLAVQTAGGTVNVLTDADTVFRIPGVEEPGLDDVKVDDQIVAGGSWESESAFHAVGVGVVGGRRGGALGAVRGRVISVSEDNLVVGTARGSLTVLVDEKTRFRVSGVENAGLDDIEEGAGIGVWGTWNEDGVLQAAVVKVGGDQGR